MNTFLKLLLSALAVIIIAEILPTVHVDNYVTAIFVAVVLALLNTFVKPILVLFTLPVTFFTLGLFVLVINAVIVLIASYLVDGFYVTSLPAALLFSLLLWAVRLVLFQFIKDK